MKDQVWNLCQLRSLKQYTQLLCLITIILNSFLKLCISSSILCTACPVGTQAQKPLMFVREESVIQESIKAGGGFNVFFDVSNSKFYRWKYWSIEI